MPNRRMFSKKVVQLDNFLEMPATSQLLYFHLGIEADDDGFVTPRKIMRMIGAMDDDLRVLITKRFVIMFEDGVLVIRDWKENNEIRVDRYHPTQFIQQKEKLSLSNNQYSMVVPMVVPNVNQMDTEVRLGKVRLGKGRENDIEPKTVQLPSPSKSKKIRNQEKDLELEEYAKKILTWFNNATDSKFKSTCSFIDNLLYWKGVYTEEDMQKAMIMIKRGKWWAKEPSPELLFRRKNPRGEPVDNIGSLLNIFEKEMKYANK